MKLEAAAPAAPVRPTKAKKKEPVNVNATVTKRIKACVLIKNGGYDTTHMNH